MAAALAAAALAVERIDVDHHTGVHPRIGAIDVVPFVPFSRNALDASADLARNFAGKLWEQLRVPVFLYEHAALHPERRNLSTFAAWRAPVLHPTSATAVIPPPEPVPSEPVTSSSPGTSGSTHPTSPSPGKSPWRHCSSSGGFPGVKALALPLASRAIVQVSINTTDFRATPLHIVFETVNQMAARVATRVLGSELIGMVPQEALDLPHPTISIGST